jgi:hypothetical protein
MNVLQIGLTFMQFKVLPMCQVHTLERVGERRIKSTLSPSRMRLHHREI